MIIVRAAESAEQALADGRMRCPRHGCGDTLKRWGYGRCRRVRGLGADTIDVRPRRVRCCGCGVTQVLLPAVLQPRRADGIVKLFGNACGAVDVSGPGGERWWLSSSFKPLRR